MNDISKNFTCNESIKEKEVRVIDAEGNQLGILQTKEAQRMADESELDLVMISPNAKPPVCKIMDLGKYIYEQAKKEKEAIDYVKRNIKALTDKWNEIHGVPSYVSK